MDAAALCAPPRLDHRGRRRVVVPAALKDLGPIATFALAAANLLAKPSRPSVES
jgi:hypothetical protein